MKIKIPKDKWDNLTWIIHTHCHCEPLPKAKAWQSLIFSGKNEIASATKVASQ